MIFATESKAACTGPLGDGYDDCVAFQLTDAPRFSATSICDYREAIGMTSSWDSGAGVLTITIDPNAGDGVPAVRHPLHDGVVEAVCEPSKPHFIPWHNASTRYEYFKWNNRQTNFDYTSGTGVFRRLLITADSARIENLYFSSGGSYVDDDDVSKSDTPPFGVGRDSRYGVCGSGRAERGTVQPLYPKTFVGSAPNCFQ